MAQYKIIGYFGTSFSNSDVIEFSTDVGTISPTSVTKGQLEEGITVTMDEGAKIIAEVSNGTCYSIISDLSVTPATAPLPTNLTELTNGWRFTAGATSIFGIPVIGFNRGTLFSCPSNYGIGYGVPPTTTQVNLPGTNCYKQDEGVLIDKGYAITGIGSVSNLALTGFTAAQPQTLIIAPCHNFTISNNLDTPITIIEAADFIETALYPLHSKLLYFYLYQCKKYEYLLSEDKIYVKVTNLVCIGDAPTWTDSSVSDNSPGTASCADGSDWYDVTQPSSGSAGILSQWEGANFPWIDSPSWIPGGKEVGGAYVKISAEAPFVPTEFAICYTNLDAYTYTNCAGDSVSGTVAEGDSVTVCGQAMTSVGGKLSVSTTNFGCSDDSGENSEYLVGMRITNADGSGNPGTGTLSGTIIGNNDTSGTWSVSYEPDVTYVDNNGNGSAITPNSYGEVTLAGITITNGVTYDLVVE